MGIWILLLSFWMQTGDLLPIDLKWKNRILIYSGSEMSHTWTDPATLKELDDRRLLYFFFKDKKLILTNCPLPIQAGSFLDLLKLQTPNESSWALVGLDGGVKNSGKTLPLSSEIFELIDAMPMRQSEIRKSGN